MNQISEQKEYIYCSTESLGIYGQPSLHWKASKLSTQKSELVGHAPVMQNQQVFFSVQQFHTFSTDACLLHTLHVTLVFLGFFKKKKKICATTLSAKVVNSQKVHSFLNFLHKTRTDVAQPWTDNQLQRNVHYKQLSLSYDGQNWCSATHSYRVRDLRDFHCFEKLTQRDTRFCSRHSNSKWFSSG